MKYLIDKKARDDIAKVDPWFWDTHEAKVFGVCFGCKYFGNGVCWFREAFPHITGDFDFCSDFKAKDGNYRVSHS